MMTIEQVKALGYQEHHTAARRGYLSRRGSGEILPYSGRFGEGFVHLKPRWDTSRYVWATYYVKEVQAK